MQRIEGAVTDCTGAVLAGAKVILHYLQISATGSFTAAGTAWRTVSSTGFGQFNNAGSTRKVQLDLRLSR